MAFSTELMIGMRHLRSRRKPAFVSLTTWISVLGIALGVTTLIVVVGVMTGFEREFRTKILGTQSHIVVVKTGSATMPAWRAVLNSIRGLPDVVAASPFVYGQAMLSTQERVVGTVVQGVDLDAEGRVTDIEKYIRSGSFERLREPRASAGGKGRRRPGVALGAELAANLGVVVGDVVTMVSPIGEVTPMGVIPRSRTFEVGGIFRSGFYQYDAGLAFVSLREGQTFFGLGTAVTGVHARVGDIFRAERISRRIQDDLGVPYWSRSWQQMNRNLFSALKTEKTTMTILLLLVIVVAVVAVSAAAAASAAAEATDSPTR